MIEESKENLKPMEKTEQETPADVDTAESSGIAPWFDSPQFLVDEPMSETITIDDFSKVGATWTLFVDGPGSVFVTLPALIDYLGLKEDPSIGEIIVRQQGWYETSAMQEETIE